MRIHGLLPTLAVEMIPSCLLLPVLTVKSPPGSPSTIVNLAFQAGESGSSPSVTDNVMTGASTLISSTDAAYWENCEGCVQSVGMKPRKQLLIKMMLLLAS